jgi:hypothetical protein
VFNVIGCKCDESFVSQRKKSAKKAAASTSRDWDFKIRESNIKRVDFNFDNHYCCDTKRIG